MSNVIYVSNWQRRSRERLQRIEAERLLQGTRERVEAVLRALDARPVDQEDECDPVFAWCIDDTPVGPVYAGIDEYAIYILSMDGEHDALVDFAEVEADVEARLSALRRALLSLGEHEGGTVEPKFSESVDIIGPHGDGVATEGEAP